MAALGRIASELVMGAERALGLQSAAFAIAWRIASLTPSGRMAN